MAKHFQRFPLVHSVICVALLLILLLLVQSTLQAQPYQHANAAEILLRMKKLRFLGSAMYIAAHPDDENTRVIATLANGDLATTAYLSLTRGDGGQNLIGAEFREELGLIRTQELLTARQIDGGQQFFSHAIDFGFSKTADETFVQWNKDRILGDVITILKTFQPDIIITRFPPTSEAGHGHHTASALLAEEAMQMINTDPKSGFVIKRLYTNTGRWWKPDINESTPGVITMDVGGVNPLIGESYAEIAARSRSQHKSQGFGTSGTRGQQLEFFEYRVGEKAISSLWEGINTSWTRIPGGEKIGKKIELLITKYTPESPERSVPDLIDLHKSVTALGKGLWRDRKLREIEALIMDCLGIFLEARSDKYQIVDNEQNQLTLELVSRSNTLVQVRKVKAKALGIDSSLNLSLKPLKLQSILLPFKANGIVTSAYWLRHATDRGSFQYPDQYLAMPATPPAQINFELEVLSYPITITRELVYRTNDPVKGEIHRRVEVVPAVTVNPDAQTWIFPGAKPREVTISVQRHGKLAEGQVRLLLPDGWASEPAEQRVSIPEGKSSQTITFKIIPPAGAQTVGQCIVNFQSGSIQSSIGMKEILYDHLPAITHQFRAEVNLSSFPLNGFDGRIGYIAGAGDDLPFLLQQVPYQLDILNPESMKPEELRKYSTLITGVRLLNTNKNVPSWWGMITQYVHEGGNLVMQYNTNNNLFINTFSPLALTLGRDRITEENSRVEITDPENPLLNYPNKITASDFEGWVQERGLYFPNRWAPEFQTPLTMKDASDPSPTRGALLMAKVGQGTFIYTGISFFRQLPEGVPGAYRLFENLIYGGKSQNQRP